MGASGARDMPARASQNQDYRIFRIRPARVLFGKRSSALGLGGIYCCGEKSEAGRSEIPSILKIQILTKTRRHIALAGGSTASASLWIPAFAGMTGG